MPAYRPHWKQWLHPYLRKWLHIPWYGAEKPPYFDDCWRYPVCSPRNLRPGGDTVDLLFLPMTDWHTRIQRTQHLALGMARRGHRCFYLSPHIGQEFPHPWLVSQKRSVRLLGQGLAEIHLHLPLEPVFHHRLLTAAEIRRLTIGLSHVMRRFRSRRAVLLVSFPLWHEVAANLRRRYGWPIIYDCHDHLAGFPAVARDIVNAEPPLIADADLVLVSAGKLWHSLAAQGVDPSRLVLLPNAVDPLLFQPARRRKGRKRIGYAGSLDSWFDVDAVKMAARAHPEWDFELVGRRESARMSELDTLPNVAFSGEIPYRAVPERLAGWDAAMIPFLLNPLTLATNPIKLYEYFACGLPVAASPLPELEPYRDLLYLAGGAEAFVRAIEAAAAETDPALREKRRRVAQSESWDARCAKLDECLARLPFGQPA
jgi:glycosyltransferase involved in cell wall biosynthesis